MPSHLATALLYLSLCVAHVPLITAVVPGRRELRHAGYTTETMIVTAALVTLALAVLAVLHTKVMEVVDGLHL
jgi:hypothetical protein